MHVMAITPGVTLSCAGLEIIEAYVFCSIGLSYSLNLRQYKMLKGFQKEKLIVGLRENEDIVTDDRGNHWDRVSFIIMLSPADILAGLLMHFQVI